MAANLETPSKQYAGVEQVLQQLLDKVTGIDSWCSTAEASLDKLLKKAEATTDRIGRLEARPPPPPPPPPYEGRGPHAQQPQRPAASTPSLHPHRARADGGDAYDLTPPGATRPSASLSGRPMGTATTNTTGMLAGES
ncbi:hypothetical protein BS78_K037600 [Paspalum vaginatum]|uniref:Uncharacterized protein n=1 Tax=Paspalum vaginatum TaxID=158149 RepID=A0A9W7XA20_9POAL|nr:hypothetical protein BS78_K037600 [Paspalum vaginatum]